MSTSVAIGTEISCPTGRRAFATGSPPLSAVETRNRNGRTQGPPRSWRGLRRGGAFWRGTSRDPAAGSAQRAPTRGWKIRGSGRSDLIPWDKCEDAVLPRRAVEVGDRGERAPGPRPHV